jgi:hypothetical protein
MSARPEEELEGSLEKTGTAKKYEVGYGRPPTQSQFKKGRSGNPTGRRRYTESERAQQLLREEGARVLTLRQGNRGREDHSGAGRGSQPIPRGSQRKDGCSKDGPSARRSAKQTSRK